MSALQELSAWIDDQRDLLFDGIERIIAVNHWDCHHDTTELVDEEFELALKEIDRKVVTTGTPYQTVITGWANNAQKLATQIEAIEGDE
ncbi:Hypothetical protein ROUS_64 [Brevibacterium phage Rousseau]|nr:Hypothetical protein ROUS_64 [Brevibacterium phage Rousseau]